MHGSEEAAFAALEQQGGGRFADPDDVARAIVFLASEQAGNITGVDLAVEAVFQDARNDLGGQLAGTFAALLTAHAVGDEKQFVGGVRDETVLVIGPFPLGAAAAYSEDEFLHAPAP